MAHLIDTGILGQLANTSDPLNPVTTQAIALLHRRNESLHTTSARISFSFL